MGNEFGLGLFILDGHQVVHIRDTLSWAQWIEDNRDKMRVAEDTIDNLWISTVFLGIDTGYSSLFGGDRVPILFETLVFVDGKGIGTMRRYRTWDEAEVGHRWVVNECRMYLDKANEKTESLIKHLLTLARQPL